jgi:hypothetical protein
MAVNWEKFDKAIDLTGLQEDIKDAQENGGTFKEVPHGQYEVKIEKLELVESKSGNPMVTCWMKVLEGDFKGSLIFYNQVVNQGFQIHLANEFLRSLESGIDVEFESYSQYEQLLMDIHEAIDGLSEYGLKYGEGKKGFSTYEITEVYEV